MVRGGNIIDKREIVCVVFEVLIREEGRIRSGEGGS
jgi:hypothetical protein